MSARRRLSSHDADTDVAFSCQTQTDVNTAGKG